MIKKYHEKYLKKIYNYQNPNKKMRAKQIHLLKALILIQNLVHVMLDLKQQLHLYKKKSFFIFPLDKTKKLTFKKIQNTNINK